MSQETLSEHAGGTAGLHGLEDHFYASVLADPLLKPLFGAGKPGHVDHRRPASPHRLADPWRQRDQGPSGLGVDLGDRS